MKEYMKKYMVRRYSTDTVFEKKINEYMLRRYSTVIIFQKKMKEYMRYAGGPRVQSTSHTTMYSVQDKELCQ